MSVQPADGAGASEQVDVAALAEILENAPAGPLVKGQFTVYKTADGGLHLAFRLDGADADGHVPVPPGLVRMALQAASGRGPLGVLLGRLG
jgi:hypothetical protein